VQYPAEVQKAALSTLARSKSSLVPSLLVRDWRSYSPTIRNDILNALVSRPEWGSSLLKEIEQGTISATQVGPAIQQKLLAHSQTGTRSRAQKLFSEDRSRSEVLKEYAKVFDLEGDSAKGKSLFQQHCTVCHRLRNEGINLGPDLTTFVGKPADLLLVAILDPNQAVEAPFVAYTATLNADRELTGIIVAENPNSITLRTAGGTDETLLRTDLKQLNGSGLSLMPEGFDKLLKPQELADLIQFITSPPAQ
jgi:putative heme-binding domain-containing protein